MIELRRSAYDAIVDHARAAAPEEACGLLAGRREDDRSTVVAAHRTENVAANPRTRYEIAPTEQLDVFDRIEERGREIVGFYHSHPAGPPRPSTTDAEQAAWPDYSYVIVDLGGVPFVGSWRWRGDDGFEQETVRIRS